MNNGRAFALLEQCGAEGYPNRLQEIEEEMKAEREQQKTQETKVSRYDYGKE